MRIAYVAFVPVSEESGVLKKLADQMHQWLKAGHEVALFALGRGTAVWTGIHDLDVRLFAAQGTLSWFWQAERLADAVLAWRPDIAYHRFGVHFPALERVLRGVPTVVELNTLDVPEYRASLSRLRFGYHLLTRGRIFRGARGLIGVTEQIAYSTGVSGKPILVLGNGIDLDAFEPALPTTAEQPRLVFIALRPQEPRYGLDKLSRFASAFPKWHFDVIGCTRAELPSHHPPNLVAHGFLARARYRELIASADIGIGTLALHREGMHEACPLKTREYLASGIAILAAYRDPDFPAGTPFVLELPNREDNVDRSHPEIAAYVGRWHKRRVERSLIEHLDTKQKEVKRLGFFAETLEDARR